jgi:hypothetical protein
VTEPAKPCSFTCPARRRRADRIPLWKVLEAPIPSRGFLYVGELSPKQTEHVVEVSPDPTEGPPADGPGISHDAPARWLRRYEQKSLCKWSQDLLRSCSRSGQALVSTPRRALDPRDREAATRGGEILGLHKAILVASAAVALWVVLFTAPSR